MHIVSLGAHTPLNTYNLWKLALSIVLHAKNIRFIEIS